VRPVSLTLSVPVEVPLVAELKVTLRVHALCAASTIPQPFATVNVGLVETLVRFSAESPELVSVMPCAELVAPVGCEPKLSDKGASVSVAGARPVPLSATVCVAGVALLLIVSEPLTPPVAVGANTMLTPHERPAASVPPQVLELTTNSTLVVMPERVSGRPPVLVSVTTCAGLLLPVVVYGKVSDAGRPGARPALLPYRSVTRPAATLAHCP